jgi:zinc protease
MKRYCVLACGFLFAAALLAPPNHARADTPDVTRATLDNGLRVVIVRDRLAPVVTTEVSYLVGSIDEPDGAPGLAHAQEHMMFRSSTGLTGDQLAVIGSGVGGNINGFTQQTVTQFIFTVPVDDLDVVLRVEAARMRGALDMDEEWNAERGAIEQEVAQRRSSALYRAHAEALAKVFEGTPYAHDALGTAFSFENINGASLRNFYSLWYAPNNAILVIAGDVDPSTTLALVQQTFGAVPRSTLPRHGDFRLSPLHASTVTEPSDLPFSMAFIAYRLPGVEDKDYAAGRILGEALSNDRADFSQLEARGKAITSGFIYSALPKASLGVAFAAIAPDADLKATAEGMQSLAATYARNGVPPDLVEAAKRREVAAVSAAGSSITGLAQLWSQALAVEGRDSPDLDLTALQAVTVADVNRVAKQYLDNDASVVAMLQRSRTPQMMTPQEGGGAESFSRNPTARVSLPSWASKVLSSLTPGVSSVNPSDMRLPNGLRVIVQRESVGSMIYVVGQVKTNENLEAPPGKEGVSLLLDGLFPYGTTSLDQLAFLKAVDDASATLTPGAKFSLTVPLQSFDQGMSLLADSLQRPALPESAFKREHAAIVAVLSPVSHQVGQSGRQILMQHLYPAGDPMRRVPTAQSITALTLRDVRAYYAKAFRPDETTIAIVGDIAPEQAQAIVAKWFGNWHVSALKPRTELPPVPPNRGDREQFWTTGVQDTVLGEETLGLGRTSSDYYAFQVGNYVFGHMSFTARLFQDLRIDKGIVYYVQGEPQFDGARSTYRLVYACDPSNLLAAEDIVRRDFALMQTTLVGQQELRQAKAMLEREIPLAEASEEDVATALVARAMDGVPLDEPQRAAQRYLTVSAADIRGVFARWLSFDRMVELVRGPR